MALSGSFTTSAYSNRSLTFSWTATQSIINNQSVISWTLKGSGSRSGYFKSGNFKVVINGETVYSSETRIDLYNGTLVASGTKTITHNSSTGKASFSASVSAGIYYVAVNCSGSGSWDLTTIARASTLDSFTCSTDYLTGTFTYKYTPKNSSLYNRLRVSIPNVVKLAEVNLGAKSASQQTATYILPLDLRESIYRRYPNTDTCSIGLVIETYSDSSYSTKIGESVEKTISLIFPLTMLPKLEGISWTKTSNEPQNWPITQGVSTGVMSMTGVSGIYGSTISTYSLTFAGLSSSSSSLTVGNIASYGTLKAIAKITDSRGRFATKEVEFVVTPYFKPKLHVTVYRSDSTGEEDAYGEYLYVNAIPVIALVGDNSLQSLVLQYKKSTDSGYISIPLTSGTDKILAASSDNTWDWIITATDKVSSSSANSSVSTGKVVLDILADGSGIGLGKVAEIPNMVAINSEWALGFGNVPVVDHIISQGTSGYWYYRKWLSGRAEAWTTSEIAFTATPSAILGGYYTSAQVDLPSGVFSKPPNCIAGGRTGTGLGFATISNVSTTMVSLGVFGNQNSTSSYITSIYAMGRWK